MSDHQLCVEFFSRYFFHYIAKPYIHLLDTFSIIFWFLFGKKLLRFSRVLRKLLIKIVHWPHHRYFYAFFFYLWLNHSLDSIFYSWSNGRDRLFKIFLCYRCHIFLVPSEHKKLNSWSNKDFGTPCTLPVLYRKTCWMACRVKKTMMKVWNQGRGPTIHNNNSHSIRPMSSKVKLFLSHSIPQNIFLHNIIHNTLKVIIRPSQFILPKFQRHNIWIERVPADSPCPPPPCWTSTYSRRWRSSSLSDRYVTVRQPIRS